MANDKNYVDTKTVEKKPVRQTKIAEKTFGQKVKDAFISEEVHDVKSYIVFDVIIPAVKETVRNLIVNTIDMSLFGKVRNSRPTEQRGGSTYIQYDRAYNSPGESRKSGHAQGAPIRITELGRIVFADKSDAIEVLAYLFENIEEYHVASVADLLGAANQQISPIHHKWGWYDLTGSSVEELPDGGYILNLPRPKAI